MDKISREQRSRIMAAVKQRGTRLERDFAKALWAAGVRYRKNVRMHGTPDILVRKAKLVVFLDSCFWHGCRFHCRWPKSNIVFWETKISRNRKRDRAVSRYYRRAGWTVLRFWEHQLARDLESCVSQVAGALRRVKR